VFGSKSRSATGIHLVGTTLRIAELSRTREGIALRGLVQEELDRFFEPRDLGSAERRQELAQVLARVGGEHGMGFDRPCIAVDPRVVLLKRRPLLGDGNRKTIREHLLWEVQQFLEDEHEAFCIDFALLRRCGFVVAVRRRVLDLYLDLFAAAGIDDLDFDIEPFALYNAAERAGLLATSGAELLLDVAGPVAHVLLLSDGEPEAVKVCTWDPEGDGSLFDALESCVRETILEGDGVGVQHMWVTGPATSSVCAELGTRLAVAGDAFDPFHDVDTSTFTHGDPALLQAGPGFAVAAGLAHRRLVE